jgi:neutral ceramidase
MKSEGRNSLFGIVTGFESILFYYCSVLLGLLVASQCLGADRIFRAGVAIVDITPTNFPIRTAGNLRLTVADKVLDPLNVRALVLDNQRIQVAIAVVDSCMIDRETMDAAKSTAQKVTGIPVERMLISSTHTHSAPAAYSCHGNDAEPAYVEVLIPKIAEAIIQAWRNRIVALVGWGEADCPQFVHCRHWIMRPGTADNPPLAFTGQRTNIAMMNPGYANTNKVRQTGVVDPSVTVLSLRTADGRPLALLANYSTHYAGVGEPGLSADYFGEFCRLIAKDLGAEEAKPFVTLMSNGTSGDANCIDFTKPDWKYDRFMVARAVTDATLKALKDVRYYDWVPLGMIEKKQSFKVRLPRPEDVVEARQFLAKNVGDRPTRNWEENYARETLKMAAWPRKKEIKLQALRIGKLGIGTTPCETFGSTGLAIKRNSPFPVTMVIGLANGCNGYLPPPAEFEVGGYTTWRARTSYLEIGAEPAIRRSVESLLAWLAYGKERLPRK